MLETEEEKTSAGLSQLQRVKYSRYKTRILGYTTDDWTLGWLWTTLQLCAAHGERREWIIPGN